jgi:regulator of replication initiation timing
METSLFQAVERLEALLISLRDQVGDLRERLDTTTQALMLELARGEGQQHRLASQLSEHLLEQQAQLLDFDFRRDAIHPAKACANSSACSCGMPRRLSIE